MRLCAERNNTSDPPTIAIFSQVIMGHFSNLRLKIHTV
jgi:hypothetical protein